LPKADLLVGAVSAASIVAKVARDGYMAEASVRFPGYGFERHVGYGTAAHRKALMELGVCPEHRKSFKPVGEIKKNTTAVGVTAEGRVAEFLGAKGHTVLARNWKTRMCEIDLVSCCDGKIYFTEVKYRKNSLHGSGLEVVDAKKLQQMKFAAECYLKFRKISLQPFLAVASVGRDDFIVQDFLVLR
jgi:ribonuclease HII